MAEQSKTSARTKDSVGRTLLVAALVSLVCSSIVASAAVMLRPYQEQNKARNKQQNILEVAGLLDSGGDVDAIFSNIETRLVDLDSGAYVEDVDGESFNPADAANDPTQSIEIPPELDVARLGRRALRGPVYISRTGESIKTVVLPVRGAGLWSTIYGLIALEPDGNTIFGLTIYEHGETPGLGDQIAKPAWQGLWPGKQVSDESGELKLQVVKGRVLANDPDAAYHIDGITGATLTGRGVANLLRYWLGDHGYGPYLRNLREENGAR